MFGMRGRMQVHVHLRRACTRGKTASLRPCVGVMGATNGNIASLSWQQLRNHLFSTETSNGNDQDTVTRQSNAPSEDSKIRPGAYSIVKKNLRFVPIHDLSESDKLQELHKEYDDLPNFQKKDEEDLPSVGPSFVQHEKPRAANPAKFQWVPPPAKTQKQVDPFKTRASDQSKFQQSIRSQQASHPAENIHGNENVSKDKHVQQTSHNHAHSNKTSNPKNTNNGTQFYPEMFMPEYNRKQRRKFRQNQRAKQRKTERTRSPKTIAQQLKESGEAVPLTDYVLINHIPPVSSLESIIQGVNDALDREVVERGGIVDLEGHWDARNGVLPVLSIPSMFPHLEFDDSTEEHHYPVDDLYRWVQEARLVLSPFGRPAGWRLKFANRSIAGALLRSTNKENPLMCAWKIVTAQEWTPQDERNMVHHLKIESSKHTAEPKKVEPIGKHYLNYDNLDMDSLDWVNDSVLRVENCNEEIDEQDLLHIFSRYDLRAPSIVRWAGKTRQGRSAPPTFLVRFLDASWARAALREKQATVVHGSAIRLVQYPKQLLLDLPAQQQHI